ncbi:type 1 periplasmic binding fold superfamily protein [Nonlabens arenilitoris]|nr:type 1 periplasmic binding fold superfamily protein [Nonlabens arenilitoris]
MKTINAINPRTMRSNAIKVLGLLAATAVFTSCDNDDDISAENEEEVITTVEYTLTSTTDANNVVVFTSVDADGEGPLSPVETVTGTLMANTVYNGSIKFLNELESPAEDITVEVAEEDDEHEVFYIDSISDLTIAKVDTDVNGNSLGLDTTFTTGASGTGTLTVVLRHEPLKPNDGTLANAGGETDVQVEFDLDVQ